VAYAIAIKPSALKEIKRLPGDVRARIKAAIDDLGSEPRPSGVKKLAGQSPALWRVRVGQYRVIYEIDDKRLVVTIMAARPRASAYR
jgi:mRNA interferase RelE/StbE